MTKAKISSGKAVAKPEAKKAAAKAAAKPATAAKAAAPKAASKPAAAKKPAAKTAAKPAAKAAARPITRAAAKPAAGFAMPRHAQPGTTRAWRPPTEPATADTRAAKKYDLPAHYAPDARARAILRGIRMTESDLRAAGGTFELEEVQEVLRHVSRQSVAKRVAEGSLLAVPGPNNRRRYPTFQFREDGTIVDGLKDVLRALPTESMWATLNFLVNPDAALGGRKPMDMLREGDISRVVAAAKLVGEAGR